MHGSVAAGAWGQCGPAAPSGRLRAAPNFTVRRPAACQAQLSAGLPGQSSLL